MRRRRRRSAFANDRNGHVALALMRVSSTREKVSRAALVPPHARHDLHHHPGSLHPHPLRPQVPALLCMSGRPAIQRLMGRSLGRTISPHYGKYAIRPFGAHRSDTRFPNRRPLPTLSSASPASASSPAEASLAEEEASREAEAGGEAPRKAEEEAPLNAEASREVSSPERCSSSAGKLTPYESFRVVFDAVRLPAVGLALFCRLLPGASSNPRAAASRVINQRMSIGAVITTPSPRNSSER